MSVFPNDRSFQFHNIIGHEDEYDVTEYCSGNGVEIGNLKPLKNDLQQHK